MKTTTKLLIIALLAVTSIGVKAQDSMTSPMNSGVNFKFGIGATAGITNENSPFGFALGGELRAQLNLSPYVAITASGGYTRLFNKDTFPGVADWDFIPAIGGVKVFPIKRMYLNANIGAGFAIQDGGKTHLIYGGGTGYEWTNGFELGVKYEGYNQDYASSTYQPQNGQFALRIGYNF